MGDTLDSIVDQMVKPGQNAVDVAREAARQAAYQLAASRHAQTLAQQAAQLRQGMSILGMGMEAAMDHARVLFAQQWARAGAATAPLWRMVTIRTGVGIWSSLTSISAPGTSVAATISGAGALGIIGVTGVVAVGSWLMLGLGYYEARKWARQEGTRIGFARGFVMGILNWKWHHAVDHFAVRHVVRSNPMDHQVEVQRALGNNEGLKQGFAVGSSASEEKKKAYRILLRHLAGRTHTGEWSRNWDMAALQQRNYVHDLVAAGFKSGVISIE